jgi:thymidylate kinase
MKLYYVDKGEEMILLLLSLWYEDNRWNVYVHRKPSYTHIHDKFRTISVRKVQNLSKQKDHSIASNIYCTKLKFSIENKKENSSK